MNRSLEFEAFEEFVQASLPVLTRAACALTGDAHLALDLVQETHIRVARHWHRVSKSGEDVLPYARKVLYRLWLDSRRWRHRHPEHLSEELEVGSTADEAEHVVARIALTSALAELGPAQRAALVMRFMEDRSEMEVAEILNTSVQSVHSLVQRALASLRKRYPELELRQ